MGELINTGRVVKTIGSRAIVRVSYQSICGLDPVSCPLNKLFFRKEGAEFLEVTAENLVQAQPGDVVNLTMPPASLTRATVLAYGSLFLAILIPILLGEYLAPRWHVLPIFPIIGFLLISIALCSLFLRRINRTFQPHYRIVQIVEFSSTEV